MSDSARSHRRQPTRLPRPWDSLGNNTGVGCHFLLQGIKVKSESEVTQSSPTLSDPMNCNLPGSSVHGLFQARVLEWGAIAFSSDLAYIWLKTIITISTWNSTQCYVPAWMGELFGREWIQVYVWLSPFAVHTKLSQQC